MLLYTNLTHFHLLTNYYYFKPHSLPIDAEVPIFFKSYNFFGFLFTTKFIYGIWLYQKYSLSMFQNLKAIICLLYNSFSVLFILYCYVSITMTHIDFEE